jgi:uncharacterized membrane protein SpoIIM required for sporulation
MKEVKFIRLNIEKWKEAETVAEQLATEPPDRVADVYADITADLAFSQTHYPTSRITIYLNNLASTLHNGIYRNKREKWSRVVTYWTREVPLNMYASRRELLASLIIFTVAVAIGALSTAKHPDFARQFLGNGYIDMTLDNIAKGNPMGVYGSGSESSMFLSITFNNVGVALKEFAFGLLTFFGSGLLLVVNGVMLGTFQEFLLQQGVLAQSMPVIWLHGTLEIASIVVAGAAGLTLGEGWIFTGTYSRLESFRRSAMRGLKIAIGTVPVFVVAGFVEGVFTRHTGAPLALRLAFIALSLAFVVFYYAVLPMMRGREARRGSDRMETT